VSLCRFFRRFGAFAFLYDGHPPLGVGLHSFAPRRLRSCQPLRAAGSSSLPRCALPAKLRHRLVGRAARPSLRGIGLSYRRNSRVGAPPISTSVKERLGGPGLREKFGDQVSKFQGSRVSKKERTVLNMEVGSQYKKILTSRAKSAREAPIRGRFRVNPKGL
jgi:hypothetical protein